VAALAGPGRSPHGRGQIWSARRWDDHGKVLNAGSADELAGHLEHAAAADED
jgi:hypothetical protein